MLALCMGGWLIFDGATALITGDYLTPRHGPHAGQLGPWASAVQVIGINPRSTIVKWIHLGLGLYWLVMAGSHFCRVPWARAGTLLCAVLSLWYLPVGTVVGLLTWLLLSLPEARRREP